MIALLLACVRPELEHLSEPHAPELEPTPTADTGSAPIVDSASPVDSSDSAEPLPVYESIADPCIRGETGPDRDCGWRYEGLTGCLVGREFGYDFGPSGWDEQALRICPTTTVEGVPCLSSEAVAQTVGHHLRVTCPPIAPGGPATVQIGGNGGGISVWTAEAWP